jgi:hypothetical protein
MKAGVKAMPGHMPYPYEGWCKGDAWAYAPGTGTYWADAWTLVGPCAGRMATDGEITQDEEVIMYPNPGKRGDEQVITLTFKNKPSHVKVIMQDINGVAAFENQYHNLTTNSLTVKIPSLSNGMYIMRIKTDVSFHTKKYLVTE